MMRLHCLVSLTALIHTTALAQFTNKNIDHSREISPQRLEPARPLTSNSAPSPISATFYPVPYWTQGLIRPYTGPAARPWLKYNAITQQLVARSASGEMEAVNTEALREFVVGDSLLGTRRVYRRYLDARLENAALRTAFFEVRYDAGRTALLCHRVVIETFNSQMRPQSGTPKPQERVRYFIKDTTNRLIPVVLTQESILKALGTEYGATLAAYASRKRLKFSRESDMILLLAHYDTL